MKKEVKCCCSGCGTDLKDMLDCSGLYTDVEKPKFYGLCENCARATVRFMSFLKTGKKNVTRKHSGKNK